MRLYKRSRGLSARLAEAQRLLAERDRENAALKAALSEALARAGVSATPAITPTAPATSAWSQTGSGTLTQSVPFHHVGERWARWRSGMTAYNKRLPKGATPVRSVSEFQRLAKSKGWAVPSHDRKHRASKAQSLKEELFLFDVMGIDRSAIPDRYRALYSTTGDKRHTISRTERVFGENEEE